MTNATLQELKTKTTPVFRRYGVLRAGVFGSYARGEAKKSSDIDFLIKYPRGITLFGIGGLKIHQGQNKVLRRKRFSSNL